MTLHYAIQREHLIAICTIQRRMGDVPVLQTLRNKPTPTPDSEAQFIPAWLRMNYLVPTVTRYALQSAICIQFQQFARETSQTIIHLFKKTGKYPSHALARFKLVEKRRVHGDNAKSVGNKREM